ncbi:hypothetical protein [Psychroflexus halocasei]|uniref:Uncharacterized protein n=1 Tax=Psychroflexus halocasei TaxID=908615 RepID=A0A1H4DPT2_9FLAO|nr:hypothetical protein [Psychroflexus halocasei]SEA74518.1 hypothetical protein SAMN05421540_1138 [Psychroflexus halocasei]
MDIVALFRVGPNVNVYRQENYVNLLISGLILGQPDIYEQAEVTIKKLPNEEYKNEYIFEAQGKIVKGHFKSALSFVDNWS